MKGTQDPSLPEVLAQAPQTLLTSSKATPARSFMTLLRLVGPSKSTRLPWEGEGNILIGGELIALAV